jgi:transcriptional regulator with XRE-family HTH domain
MIDRAEAGRRIKAARESIGLTQLSAATCLGMPRQQLSQIENGRRVPAWPVMVEIVTKLGLDPRTVVPELFDDGG